MSNEGQIYRISGPVVTAKGMNAAMYDVVRVGDEGLMGEVIEIHGDQSVIQVYEDTSGIRPGEPVLNTQETLSVALGPGLLTQIYDGIQRPLQTLEEQMGFFITRGVDATPLTWRRPGPLSHKSPRAMRWSAAKSSATSKKPRPSFTKSWSRPAKAAR